MNTPPPFSDAELLALAPIDLVSKRTIRYDGSDMGIVLSDFVASDQQLVQQLYATMSELLLVIEPHKEHFDQGIEQVRLFMQRNNWGTFVRRVQQFGDATCEQQHGNLILTRKVLHDLKGGSFQALSINLQLLEMGYSEKGDLLRMFFLTRDYLKIMRTGVRDVDPPRYAQDMIQKAHGVDLLVEKWHHAVHKLQDVSAEVVITSRFQGNISERCLEFASLDRVLYNLINNAARNTADQKIYLTMLPVTGDPPLNVRFVVYNKVSADHQRLLQQRYPDGLSALFYGGFTTGGTGLGMRICADFVSNAYGVQNVEDCLKAGYIGAQASAGYFINWFHWPVAGD